MFSREREIPIGTKTLAGAFTVGMLLFGFFLFDSLWFHLLRLTLFLVLITPLFTIFFESTHRRVHAFLRTRYAGLIVLTWVLLPALLYRVGLFLNYGAFPEISGLFFGFEVPVEYAVAIIAGIFLLHNAFPAQSGRIIFDIVLVLVFGGVLATAGRKFLMSFEYALASDNFIFRDMLAYYNLVIFVVLPVLLITYVYCYSPVETRYRFVRVSHWFLRLAGTIIIIYVLAHLLWYVEHDRIQLLRLQLSQESLILALYIFLVFGIGHEFILKGVLYHIVETTLQKRFNKPQPEYSVLLTAFLNTVMYFSFGIEIMCIVFLVNLLLVLRLLQTNSLMIPIAGQTVFQIFLYYIVQR